MNGYGFLGIGGAGGGKTAVVGHKRANSVLVTPY